MPIYTYQESTTHSYPNFTVYDWLEDGVLIGWRVNPNEGYVFYDINEHATDLDPETGEEVEVHFYYTVRYFPDDYNWENFSLVAVPRSEVGEEEF